MNNDKVVARFWGLDQYKSTNITATEDISNLKISKERDNNKEIVNLVRYEVDDLQNSYVSLGNTTLKEIEDELYTLKDTIEGLELTKAYLIERYINLKKTWELDSLLIQNGSAERLSHIKDLINVELITYKDKQFVEVTMDFLLPHYVKNVQNKLRYYHILNTAYKFHLSERLKELNLHNFKNEKVFVQIVQYMKGNQKIDLDNRFHSFIFNALRAAHLINDDSWRDIAYMENGFTSKNGKSYTTILISKYSDLAIAIQYMNNN